ncbi:hypothetical protein [Caballeronia arationis]|uniref:hypothetical protein n=1 Tax=Caballeronia arationis TaxID=1777142 RepID=UPI0011982688|nr:hypothetical protein [Caballeronia arationis]
MRQLQRQGLVAAMEDYRPQVEPGQKVAVEGFMEFIHDLFSKKVGPIRNDDLKNIWWKMDKIEALVRDTIANEQWVAKHYSHRPIKLGKKDLNELVVNGKIVKPIVAMDNAKKLVDMLDHAQNSNGEFDRFNKELRKAQEDIEKFYESQHPPKVEAVERYAEEVIKKIQVPGPKTNDHMKHVWGPRQKHYQHVATLHGSELPELSQAEVVQTGKAVLTALEDVKRYEKAAWRQTSNYGADWGEWKFFEDSDGYDAEDLRVGPIGDFFYYQGLPTDCAEEITMAAHDFKDAVVSSIAWTTLLCGGEKVFGDEVQ